MHFEYDPTVRNLRMELSESSRLLHEINEDDLSEIEYGDFFYLASTHTDIKNLINLAAKYKLADCGYTEEEIGDFTHTDFTHVVLSPYVTRNLLRICEEFEDDIASWKASLTY